MNPFSQLEGRQDWERNICFYIAPEDVRDKMSGGHYEAITDAYHLSYIYRRVDILFPDNGNDQFKNELIKEVLDTRKNIKLKPIKKNKGIKGALSLSMNRLRGGLVVHEALKASPDVVVVGCHRNISVQWSLLLKRGGFKIIFKSYGSIFKHNIDNLMCNVQTGDISSITGKYAVNAIFYGLVEGLSYIKIDMAFLTRDKGDTPKYPTRWIFDWIFKENAVYRCSGPYWYMKERANENTGKEAGAEDEHKEEIVIGSIGDNTFGTALRGVKKLINSVISANHRNKKILVRIAGKYDRRLVRTVEHANRKCETVNVKIEGYVESSENFLKELDGVLVGVSGGSAMPIKALETILIVKKPTLTTNYVISSCKYFIGVSNANVYSERNCEEYLQKLLDLKSRTKGR